MIKKFLFKQRGNNSSNQQAHTINNYGLNYSDAKDMMLDIFETNFVRLSESASQLALKRAEELTTQYLTKLKDENPEAIQTIEDPDMLYILLEAQKQYARNGEPILREMLVDLLVKRTEENDRTLKQIVLNESIITVPRLTNIQIDILTICFLITECRFDFIREVGDFIGFIDTFLASKFDDLGILEIPLSDSNIRHLEYVGCASIAPSESSLSKIFRRNYRSIFTSEFNLDQLFVEEDFKDILKEHFLSPSKEKTNLYHMRNLHYLDILQKIQELGLDDTSSERIMNIREEFELTDDEIYEVLTKVDSRMIGLFNFWESSIISEMQLTSVGKAIAHTNICKVYNIHDPLDIWIH